MRDGVLIGSPLSMLLYCIALKHMIDEASEMLRSLVIVSIYVAI